MNRLPSAEECDWLTRALKTLIGKRGVRLLDNAPLVEPTNEWFPERWSTTAAHGHRLAQRLMFYAGLGALRPTLSAFDAVADEDGTEPWDTGTAGWFAGIEDGRAHFGLHVGQFSDPEAAAGVLAHEVAHAWRAQHRLVIDDRQEEELLTDVTTIMLGFGILSTNNTDRYRSSGTWESTAWSLSSAGYLPPQAMTYVLALWCCARNKRGEQKSIERHLEPNQLACFRTALEAIESADKSPREILGDGSGVTEGARIEVPAFVPYEPSESEIEEPEDEEDEATEINRGRTVYRTSTGVGSRLYIGAIAGFVPGMVVGLWILGIDRVGSAMLIGLASSAMFALLLAYARRDVCSACSAKVSSDVAVCSGCGGTLGRRVSTRELYRIREEELEFAAREVEYEDCDRCEPERPCEKHR